MYDLIGDIHGHADELMQLLERLGYDQRRGYYSHPLRKAVFVGDFIDRGPQIPVTLELVRHMTDHGAALAVMGNHEFNAIAYHTRHPSDKSRFLRPHSAKNIKQHLETLRQVPRPALYDYLEWFKTLPMWLDLEGLRVVHACWDEGYQSAIRNALGELHGLSTGFLLAATNRSTDLYCAVNAVLKGIEIDVPEGKSFRDSEGAQRHRFRVRWYQPPLGRTYANYSFSPDLSLPDSELPSQLVKEIRGYPTAAVPVFFGHYWLPPEPPARLASNVACLDYSVAKGGALCAYRWDGERELANEKFVWIDAGGTRNASSP